MKNVRLGRTGIVTPQNGFGALPVQRVERQAAVRLLRRAYDGGFRFYDTARAYSDSEEKLGEAFEGLRDNIVIASKTQAKTADKLWEDLHTTLRNLRTDRLDIYQLHCADLCYRPDDGSGLYEALLEAKKQGKILHIGITAHKIGVAEEIAVSGLYETLQFPFCYLAADRDVALVDMCRRNDVGFIAMKGLSGGLLTDYRACMAFTAQYDNVLPIWGIQRESELDQWLSCFDDTPEMTDGIRKTIEEDRQELLGEFCRGCGYCMPCTAGIQINQCARMSQMIRRSPSANFLGDFWQGEMEKIASCVNCGACLPRCPYELNIPELLKKNLADYRDIIAGRASV